MWLAAVRRRNDAVDRAVYAAARTDVGDDLAADMLKCLQLGGPLLCFEGILLGRGAHLDTAVLPGA